MKEIDTTIDSKECGKTVAFERRLQKMKMSNNCGKNELEAMKRKLMNKPKKRDYTFRKKESSGPTTDLLRINENNSAEIAPIIDPPATIANALEGELFLATAFSTLASNGSDTPSTRSKPSQPNTIGAARPVSETQNDKANSTTSSAADAWTYMQSFLIRDISDLGGKIKTVEDQIVALNNIAKSLERERRAKRDKLAEVEEIIATSK